MLSAFKTRYFQRWMRKTDLTDHNLYCAIREMSQGLIDADLGGGIVKKRIGLAGRGKSNGIRTLVATNKGDRWFFVFGFAKNNRANVTAAELEALQILAIDLLALTCSQLAKAVQDGSLQEIYHDNQNTK